MSHITLANQGIAAADARNWDDAISKLSKALQGSANPAWILTRSRALINVQRYQEALDDADLAFHVAYERNKRELLVESQYRRAVAYFRMKEYANADCCCLYSMRLIKGLPALEKEDIKAEHTDASGFWTATLAEATTEAQTDEFNKGKAGGMDVAMGQDKPKNATEWRRASTLRIQSLGAMEKLPADDHGRKATVTQKPVRKELSKLNADKVVADKTKDSQPAAAVPAVKPVVPKDTPMRLQEFQSTTTMNVSIFSKGVNKDKLQVEFLPSSVRMNPMIYPSGDEREFFLDLWDEIDGAASKYTVTANKVELTLTKKTAGKWPQLKKDEAASSEPSKEQKELELMKEARKKAMDTADKPAVEPAPSATTSDVKPAVEDTAAKSAGPAYPSSSRTGPKNWDQIGADMDEDEENGVNDFFKKIYKNATPEQQRAMMKSFTESNGTSLSTDWSDVSKRTVETVPPEGVEAKKW